MKTLFLLSVVVILCAACVQSVAASGGCWPGAFNFCGHPGYGHQVFLNSWQGVAAPACGLLSTSDLDSQRRKRGDEEGEKEKERKEEEKERHEEEPEGEADSSGSCFGSFLESLFFSDDDDDDELALAPERPISPLL
jgi:hypothetical protein